MKILLATNNGDKVKEIKEKLAGLNLEAVTLKEIGMEIEVEEDRDTLEGNAMKKAKEIYELTGIPTMADDTGLFVDALNGEPGVYSSRYAGENASYDDNCRKLLEEMRDVSEDERNAYFKTVICFYYDEDRQYYFEGTVQGRIIREKRGMEGFGYDPVFVPDGYMRTYAEMPLNEKNKLSHRGRAVEQLRNFLSKNKDKFK